MAWRSMVVWAVCFAVGLLGTELLRAQDLEPGGEGKRVVVKRYVELSADAVYAAARDGARAQVRFSDSFDRPVSVPASLRRIVVDDVRYTAALAFRTEANLYCIVSSDNEEGGRKAKALSKGQKITIEGSILGAVGLGKYVFVDMILTGSEKRSKIENELLLRWPGTPPQRISSPGVYQLSLPCNHVEGEVVEVRLEVARKDPEAFRKELRERLGEQAREPRTYERFEAASVYRLAARGRQADVRFEDLFKRVATAERLLREAVVKGRGRFGIGYAFDTYSGLTCLIPLGSREQLEKARLSLPDQRLAIEGTVVGKLGAYYCVLVDEIEFPDLEGKLEKADIWEIRVFWGEETPKRFHVPGSYLLNVPCQYAEGMVEQIALELREVRVIAAEKAAEEEPQTRPSEGSTPGY